MTNEAKLQQTVSAPKAKKRKVASLDKKKARAGWVFVLPFVIGFLLVYLPIIWNSIFMSFHSLHIVTGGGYTLEFVGLENYSDALFEDPLFVQTLIQGLKELAFDVPAILIFSLFMAVLLNQKMAGRAVFRAIIGGASGQRKFRPHIERPAPDIQINIVSIRRQRQLRAPVEAHRVGIVHRIFPRQRQHQRRRITQRLQITPYLARVGDAAGRDTVISHISLGKRAETQHTCHHRAQKTHQITHIKSSICHLDAFPADRFRQNPRKNQPASISVISFTIRSASTPIITYLTKRAPFLTARNAPM